MNDEQPGEPGTPDWRLGPEDEIAALVFQLAIHLAADVSRLVAPFGLTEPQARLVRRLRQPLPMRTVADHLHCDASNLTGIVDRLEARGLVERRMVPTDHRVKELVLTEAGRHLQGQLDELTSRVPGLSDLSSDEQQTLIRLLRVVFESQLRTSEDRPDQVASA